MWSCLWVRSGYLGALSPCYAGNWFEACHWSTWLIDQLWCDACRNVPWFWKGTPVLKVCKCIGRKYRYVCKQLLCSPATVYPVTSSSLALGAISSVCMSRLLFCWSHTVIACFVDTNKVYSCFVSILSSVQDERLTGIIFGRLLTEWVKLVMWVDFILAAYQKPSNNIFWEHITPPTQWTSNYAVVSFDADSCVWEHHVSKVFWSLSLSKELSFELA